MKNFIVAVAVFAVAVVSIAVTVVAVSTLVAVNLLDTRLAFLSSGKLRENHVSNMGFLDYSASTLKNKDLAGLKHCKCFPLKYSSHTR